MTNNNLENEDQDEFEHYRFKADPKQQLLRIDKFLIDRIPNTSRTKLQAAIKAGSVTVNDKEVKSNYKIRPNDEIAIVLSYPKEDYELVPQDIPLNVVYEDEGVAVIDKEAGMVVHPGYGNNDGTLVNALIYHFNKLPLRDSDNFRPGIVHRIDKNTSGLLVIAKSDFCLAHLSKQFFNRTTDRRYLALVWGDVTEDSGTIEGHIGRSLKNRKVMSVFPDGEFGKPAITHWKVVERFNYITLIECKLDTGRTHQIRAHFKYIGHPLFGDVEYGGNKVLKGTTFTKYKQFVENCFQILPRQALHAKSLSFDHPISGKRLSFESPLPHDMELVIEKWKTYISTRN